MKKIWIAFLVSLFGQGMTQAQTADDALRYSRIFYSGTARFNGLGGAFGAVGADFSTVATNPAGLGLYSKSELTFTLAPTIGNVSSVYNGDKVNSSRVNFGIGNFGYVLSINPSGNGRILKNINIGFGFNRQNDFNNSAVIRGFNAKNSMMQSYVNVLNENPIPENRVRDKYPFDIGLAYDAWLIGYDSAMGSYFCDAAYGGVLQRKEIVTYGSINEMDFSVGANLANSFFIGLTVGVPFLRYYENSVYTEENIYDTIPEFQYLYYRYNLQTRGTGINVKLGMIYIPVSWVRIGASFHTPTWYPGMQDEWFSSMESSFVTTSWGSTQYSPVGFYNYKLRTPWRAFGSVAFIIGEYGLVSADYEYVNYSQARFNSSNDSYTHVNDEIQSNYQSWGNIKIGTEWGVAPFRIRAGFAYFSNPYKNNLNNSERFQVSGGLGYRSRSFFADVSYVWTSMKQDYYLYDPAMVNPANLNYSTHTVLTTVGFRF